jgi:hydroxymethylbilane synthase
VTPDLQTQKTQGLPLRLATRASALALQQTRWVADQLSLHWPKLDISIHTMSTLGDERLDTALHAVGDKGLFTHSLEQALQEGTVDIAIHSAKDLPTQLDPVFSLCALHPREDARDVLLGPYPWADVPKGATIGTSALRRVAQLQALRPDLRFTAVRGNLQTRWQKLQAGQCDTLVLAAAGVHRLGWHQRIQHYFDPVNQLIPAVGQGILAAEYCNSDMAMYLAPLCNEALEITWQLERAFLRHMQGGCQVAIAAHVYQNTLYAAWFANNAPPGVYGQLPLPISHANHPLALEEAKALGQQLAEQLLSKYS